MDIKSIIKAKTIIIIISVIVACGAVWGFIYVMNEKVEKTTIVKEHPSVQNQEKKYKDIDEVVRDAHRNVAKKMEQWEEENKKKYEDWKNSEDSKKGFGVPPM